MNTLVSWFYRYNTEITWFVIGWLSLDLIREFGQGNWEGVAFDAVLIALNYHMNKR